LSFKSKSERDAGLDAGDQLFGGFGGVKSAAGKKKVAVAATATDTAAGSVAAASSNANSAGAAQGNNVTASSGANGNNVTNNTVSVRTSDQSSQNDNSDVVSLAENSIIENRKVKKLFSYFNADLIQGRSVNAMAWNVVNSDLLAVGYGKLDDYVDNFKPGEAVNEELKGGLILFWSLRNSDFPEKILRTANPVTSLDFSKLSPMMLAVGFMNGDICIYDTKRESDWGKPIKTSANINGGHSDPVW